MVMEWKKEKQLGVFLPPTTTKIFTNRIEILKYEINR